MKIKCPQCNAVQKIPVEYMKKPIKCISCKMEIIPNLLNEEQFDNNNSSNSSKKCPSIGSSKLEPFFAHLLAYHGAGITTLCLLSGFIFIIVGSFLLANPTRSLEEKIAHQRWENEYSQSFEVYDFFKKAYKDTEDPYFRSAAKKASKQADVRQYELWKKEPKGSNMIPGTVCFLLGIFLLIGVFVISSAIDKLVLRGDAQMEEFTLTTEQLENALEKYGTKRKLL